MSGGLQLVNSHHTLITAYLTWLPWLQDPWSLVTTYLT